MFRADKGTMRVRRTRKSWKASTNWGTWNLFRLDVMWTSLSVSLSSPDLICLNRPSSLQIINWSGSLHKFTAVGLIYRAVPDFSASLALKLSRIYVDVKREQIIHAVSLFALVISSQLQRNTKTLANNTETKANICLHLVLHNIFLRFVKRSVIKNCAARFSAIVIVAFSLVKLDFKSHSAKTIYPEVNFRTISHSNFAIN